jgi:hypothetical protein
MGLVRGRRKAGWGAGWLVAALLLLGVSGCSTAKFADGFALAVMDQPDPETVRDGVPAYLLLIDSLIQRSPENPGLLTAGANLYGMYAGIFVEDPERARRLSSRSREYGARAVCAGKNSACGLADRNYNDFVAALPSFRRGDVPELHALTVGWLVWLRAHSDDWSALSDLPKIEKALERLVQLDEKYERGSAHLYLGILKTLRPPALGGDPEGGRRHFERALEISEGHDLTVKVEFARHYARLVYDRELHDSLLREVLADASKAPGLGLFNALAKREARLLLESAADYF